MPTGIALHDARGKLFDAAERVLLRDGPSGLTSRAVTAEAGVAKGVLHRHFADFDAFLAELVADRTERMRRDAAGLQEATATGNVEDHLTRMLLQVFGSVGLEIVALVISRPALLARLRTTTPTGLPLLAEATTSIAAYLAAEREAHRVAAEADIEALALTLVGTAHLLFAGRGRTPPETGAVHAMVKTVMAGVVRA